MDKNLILIRLLQLLREWRTCRPWQIQAQAQRRRQILLLLMLYRLHNRKTRKTRRFWVRPIFTVSERLQQGASDNLVRTMENLDPDKYFEYLRMPFECFNTLLELLRPRIEKQHVVRAPIPARTRLHITLRYLASGDIMPSISFAFRVGTATVSRIVSETCHAIWDVLSDEVFEEIDSDMWREKGEEFEDRWNFPNCIGAIDGRHMELIAPPHCGSSFYNYKGSHSIVLLAIADANCLFTAIDVGARGRRSDGGIFMESEIGKRLRDNEFNLPAWRSLEEGGPKLPFVLIGDEAFALSLTMLRPFPRAHTLSLERKVFNYRLSRARRIVECAFGILTSRWRIFRRPLTTNVRNAIAIISATVCLHNFVMKREAQLAVENRQYSIYSAENDRDREGHYFTHTDAHAEESITTTDQENTMCPAEENTTMPARAVRDAFCNYFCNNGAIQNQWDRALNNDY